MWKTKLSKVRQLLGAPLAAEGREGFVPLPSSCSAPNTQAWDQSLPFPVQKSPLEAGTDTDPSFLLCPRPPTAWFRGDLRLDTDQGAGWDGSLGQRPPSSYSHTEGGWTPGSEARQAPGTGRPRFLFLHWNCQYQTFRQLRTDQTPLRSVRTVGGGRVEGRCPWEVGSCVPASRGERTVQKHYVMHPRLTVTTGHAGLRLRPGL